MKRSICITTLNDARNLESSLSSLLSQADTDESEVAVVDSRGTDGSTEILTGCEAHRRLRLVIRRPSVGMGRQLAILNTTFQKSPAHHDLFGDSRSSSAGVRSNAGRVRQGINHFGSGDVSSMSLQDVEASEKVSSLIPVRTPGTRQESVMVHIRQCQS